MIGGFSGAPRVCGTLLQDALFAYVAPETLRVAHPCACMVIAVFFQDD